MPLVWRKVQHGGTCTYFNTSTGSTRWWLLVDHCVLRNWDRILVRAVKGLGLAWSRYVHYCDKETLNSNKPKYKHRNWLYVHIHPSRNSDQIASLLSPAAPKARDGRYCNAPHLSVRLSVTFSFRTVTKKRIDVFSRNFAGTCTKSWGCAV